LQNESQESAVALDKKEKPKMVETASGLAVLKVMLTVQEVRKSKSARSHRALMLFPAKNGNVVVKGQ
jgi:hypothetical protein